jgi:hypothetical protein
VRIVISSKSINFLVPGSVGKPTGICEKMYGSKFRLSRLSAELGFQLRTTKRNSMTKIRLISLNFRG